MSRFIASLKSLFRRQIELNVASLLAAVLAVTLGGKLQSQQTGSGVKPTSAAVSTASVEQLIREFSEDQETLGRRLRIVMDEAAFQTRAQLYADYLTRLQAVDFAALDRDGRLDYQLIKTKIEYLQARHQLNGQRDNEAAEYLPFAQPIVQFCVNRENVEPISPKVTATLFDSTATTIESLLSKNKSNSAEISIPQKLKALRAVEMLKSLKGSLNESDSFYQGYDPSYSWWCKKPIERLQSAIEGYNSYLQERVVGVAKNDVDTIIGLPIGAAGIALELKHEWIAHTPEELLKIAEREMAWCENEFKKVASDMGCEDWRQALEKVKLNYVEPGQQPEMIRKLAEEAIQYVRERDLMTVPDMAARGWRMTMMSPERQRVNPYFLGGESIIVSFPTDSMSHEEKLMSLRSNNEHFARATVHHELIPGHHMQYYMQARYRPYRGIFSTPFWIEGWALHWEMLLWDLGFARGPEDRAGMLFWRKHRCARIIFSLNYHLGNMTPQQCIDYLVENVGHERSAAAAEVRRSIMGGYGPMYQAAYMLGGLQIRKMHEELVKSGKMTNREFHDAVLKQHSIPIEPLRNYLSGAELRPEASPAWRFGE
jgi:uncharacterized protein (DUF885 family)